MPTRNATVMFWFATAIAVIALGVAWSAWKAPMIPVAIIATIAVVVAFAAAARILVVVTRAGQRHPTK